MDEIPRTLKVVAILVMVVVLVAIGFHSWWLIMGSILVGAAALLLVIWLLHV